jgi:hypothetical protein
VKHSPCIYAPAKFWVKGAVFHHAVGVEEDAADPVAEADLAKTTWGAVAPGEARK